MCCTLNNFHVSHKCFWVNFQFSSLNIILWVGKEVQILHIRINNFHGTFLIFLALVFRPCGGTDAWTKLGANHAWWGNICAIIHALVKTEFLINLPMFYAFCTLLLAYAHSVWESPVNLLFGRHASCSFGSRIRSRESAAWPNRQQASWRTKLTGVSVGEL